MKLSFRLYILAFVGIGLNIPEIESVPPIRMLQNIFSPRHRRDQNRRPGPYRELDHSASESVYMYGDSTYTVPEIDNHEINYSNSDTLEKYMTPPDPLGQVGHQNPHMLRKLKVRQLLDNNQFPSGGLEGNFNPSITTLRQLNPPPSNAISNNIGGQFPVVLNLQVPQQQSFPQFSPNLFAPQSDPGLRAFAPLPPVSQQPPADFSGGFSPIDPVLRQNIPDFSRAPPQSLNSLPQSTVPTTLFSPNFNQSFTTPLIVIGKPPPEGYRIEDYFQQSFLVSLIPEVSQRRKRDLMDNMQVESSISSQSFNPQSTVYQVPIQASSSYAIPAQSNTYEAPVRIPHSFAASTVQSESYGEPAKLSGFYEEVPIQTVKYSAPIQTSSGYSAPIKNTYEAPAQTSSNYGAPIQTNKYEAPSQVSSNYGAPTQTYSTTYEVPVQVSSNSYGVPNAYEAPKISKAYGAPQKLKDLKQGSIITKSKILFSPRLLAIRSMPFRVDRIQPPNRTLTTGFSHPDETIELIANISRLANNTNSPNPTIGTKKTLVAVHIQSFSILRPPGNDSDLIEGQKNHGFGAHNFQFGGADSLLTVFENLLKTGDSTTVSNNGLNSGYGYADGSNNGIHSGVDPIDGILNMINATERIHVWAHNRGEDEASRRFQSFPRDNITDAIPFIDTAPITKTLSAAIF